MRISNLFSSLSIIAWSWIWTCWISKASFNPISWSQTVYTEIEHLPSTVLVCIAMLQWLRTTSESKSEFIGLLQVADEPPHQICSYTLLFSLFLHFLYIADPPLRTSAPMQPHVITLAQQSHLLYQTELAYLMDIWLMIHMYLLLFLVSPTCPLLQSNQSRALTPCGQALFLTLPYAHFLVFHSYLTCLYLPFDRNIITEALTNCLYESPPELRFSTYASHHLTLISHYFASHRTATIALSLLATIHLETIPYPQITPPQSLIRFILRSPAP